MRTKLTLRLDGYTNTTRDDSGGHVWKYKVVGDLPPGERISVMEDGMSRRWQVFHTKDGVVMDWPEDYKSAEGALEAIQKEFEE
jgi:hypothetical protein